MTEEGGPNQILDLETGAVRRELGSPPAGGGPGPQRGRPVGGELRLALGPRPALECRHGSDGPRMGPREADARLLHPRQPRPDHLPGRRVQLLGRGDLAADPPAAAATSPSYPGHVAFSPDGRLMALEMAPAVIHLKEVATGRTVAKLEDPHGDRATWQGFTPDGTQLVVVASYASAIHIWDLRAIRTRLKDMNLDWDWPEFPPAATGDPAAEPVTIEVLPADRARPALTREQRARAGHRALPREGRSEPGLGAGLQRAGLGLSDGARGAARRGGRFAPGRESGAAGARRMRIYRNTLGVAYYRAGRYREAVEVLRPNLEKQEDRGLAYDLYFLAMSHHRLGEAARARDYYDWAVRWAQVQRDLDARAPRRAGRVPRRSRGAAGDRPEEGLTTTRRVRWMGRTCERKMQVVGDRQSTDPCFQAVPTPCRSSPRSRRKPGPFAIADPPRTRRPGTR